MLAAISRMEELPLLSPDTVFDAIGVTRVWTWALVIPARGVGRGSRIAPIINWAPCAKSCPATDQGGFRVSPKSCKHQPGLPAGNPGCGRNHLVLSAP
jgi:hypothetical protein